MTIVSFHLPVLAFSLEDTKQVVLCGVEKAEILHVFPVQNSITCMHWMEVAEDSRYVKYSWDQTSGSKDFWWLTYFCFEMSVCLSALGSFCSSEDESKLFLPKLPTLPKRYRQYLEHIVMSHTDLIFIVCLFFLKLCLHSYSTSSKIFRWAHHLYSGIYFHKSSFCCCICLMH